LQQVALGTLFGRLALARCALFVTVLIVVWLRPARADFAVSVLAGTALVLLGWTSHAAAAVAVEYNTLFAVIDALHLLAGGFWLGGLVALVPSVMTKSDGKTALLARLRLFSRWAMAAVALLAAAGTANAIAILDFRGMRWSVVYLTWLAIKLVLAGIMVALALTNRFGVTPALVRGDALRLPFAAAAFDAVVSTEAFHWFPDQDAALAETARVLRRDGTLLLGFVNPPLAVIGDVFRLGSRLVGAPLAWPTPAALRRRVEAAGFSVTAQRRIFRVPGFLLPPVLTEARRL